MRHPNVPESLEGWWILHRLFSFDRLILGSPASEADRENDHYQRSRFAAMAEFQKSAKIPIWAWHNFWVTRPI